MPTKPKRGRPPRTDHPQRVEVLLSRAAVTHVDQLAKDAECSRSEAIERAVLALRKLPAK